MSEVLLVEATEELQSLAEELERAGVRVRTCSMAEAGERLSGSERFDALVINLMEHQAGDVGELLQGRSLPSGMPVLVVLRRQQLAELGPELPADDFVVFPAVADEVIARIRRAGRPGPAPADAHLLHCGELTIDQASYKVYAGNRPVDLTYKEYELLRFLALNPDKVFTRETLLNRVWGYDFYGGARTVDVHIRRLRSKIEDHTHSLIETVRNVGYRLHAG